MRTRTHRNIAVSVTTIAVAAAGTVMMMAGCAKTADYSGDDVSSPAAVEAATTDNAETVATEETTSETTTDTTDVGEAVGMPNPIVEYETLEEAEKAVGFEFTVPESIDGYDGISYSVISNELIQVIYSNEDGASIMIRKAAGSDDISGDYNDYSTIEDAAIGEYPLTLKGDNELVNLAVWNDDEYAYSIGATDACSREAMLTMIGEVQ